MDDILEVGEPVELIGFFEAPKGTPKNPTTVTLTITRPDGTNVTVLQAAMSNPELGDWRYIYATTQAGRHLYRFAGTGAVAQGETGEFMVYVVGTRSTTGFCEDWFDWNDLPCTVDLSTLPGGDAIPYQDAVIDYVGQVMWRLSCEQFGICETTAWPIRCCRHGARSWSQWAAGGWYGYLWDPNYANDNVCCGQYEYLMLGDAPIVTVQEVMIDGVVFDPANYRVDDYHRLVRTDGDIWPSCNRLELDGAGVDSWHVRWSYGVAVPPGGRMAAALYGCEVAKNLAGLECALPPGTTSASRDGVTVNIIDTAEAVASGKTGVLLTDMWLETVCPGGPSKGMSGAIDLGKKRNWTRVGT